MIQLPASNRFWLSVAWMALCASLAAYFIFDHLGLRAFWLDEAGTANLLTVSFWKLPAKAAIDGCPIFYVFLLKGWAALFGDSEFALRSFSAFFALVSVAAFYPIGKSLFRDTATGIFASFLAATNYFLIFFATQTRAYTLSAFTGLLGFYCFVRFALSGSKKDGWAYWSAATASLYLHPWLFLVFGSQILSGFFFRRTCRAYKKVAVTQLVILVCALPNILVTLYQGKLNANSWMAKPSLWVLAQAPANLSYGSSWIYLAAAALAGAVLLFKKGDQAPVFSERAFVRTSLVTYLFLPIVAAWGVSQFSPAYVPARYEMIVLPAFLLLAAHFFSVLRKFVPLVVLLAICLAGATFNSVTDERRMVEAYQSNDKTAIADLLSRIQEGDAVVASDLSLSTTTYYFHRLNAGEKAVPFDLLPFPAEIAEHPSWKNEALLLADRSRYEEEARRLALSLKPRALEGHTVWVLARSTGPVSRILKEAFSEMFLLSHSDRLPTPRERSWFDEILSFRR